MPPRRKLTLAAVDRATEIVEARTRRETFASIGARYGLSAQRVCQIYWDAVRSIPAEAVEHLRREQNALADLAESKLLDIINDPKCSNRTAVEALGTICRWERHRAQLNGTDVDRRVSEDERLNDAGVPGNLHELVARRVVELRSEAS